MKEETIHWNIEAISKEIKGTIYTIQPDKKNFFCPFTLFLPEGTKGEKRILVNPVNTGYKVCYTLASAGEEALASAKSISLSMILASDLKLPLLTPLFPRISGYYTQSLGHDVFHNDITCFKEINNKRNPEQRLTEREIEDIKNIVYNMPEQLLSMIEKAKEILHHLKIIPKNKIIIEGYSAASRFANLFTALHPSKVKICIGGGISGLPILPIQEKDGYILNYPLGINDLEKFDISAFKKVKHFYYIGKEDDNDPAMYAYKYKQKSDGSYEVDECNNKIPLLSSDGFLIPILDKEGKYTAKYKENFLDEEVNIIFSLIGKTNQERFHFSKKIYFEMGINATFKEYSGNHLDFIFTNTRIGNRQVLQDIEDFIIKKDH